MPGRTRCARIPCMQQLHLVRWATWRLILYGRALFAAARATPRMTLAACCVIGHTAAETFMFHERFPPSWPMPVSRVTCQGVTCSNTSTPHALCLQLPGYLPMKVAASYARGQSPPQSRKTSSTGYTYELVRMSQKNTACMKVGWRSTAGALGSACNINRAAVSTCTWHPSRMQSPMQMRGPA
jgi:hypothetical protein